MGKLTLTIAQFPTYSVDKWEIVGQSGGLFLKQLDKSTGVNVFRGVNSLVIDDKGRLAIPARYREDLLEESAPQLVVTIDTESTCLLIYPCSQWEIIEKKIEALPSFNPAARRIQRLLIGHATETALDSNGRILLPQALRDYAKLSKNVMLIGQGKKFELWDEQHWLDCRKSWLEEATQVGELPADLLSLSL